MAKDIELKKDCISFKYAFKTCKIKIALLNLSV